MEFCHWKWGLREKSACTLRCTSLSRSIEGTCTEMLLVFILVKIQSLVKYLLLSVYPVSPFFTPLQSFLSVFSHLTKIWSTKWNRVTFAKFQDIFPSMVHLCLGFHVYTKGRITENISSIIRSFCLSVAVFWNCYFQI